MQADTKNAVSGAFYKRQNALLNKLYRRIVPLVRRKDGVLHNSGPIVSFTFDDFPSSAIRIGGPILRRYGVKATFYVSMGNLAADAAEDAVTFTADDLREVAAEGHEIACHTHGHLDCALTSPETLIRDLELNAAAVQQILPGYRMTNFAYPYGNVDLASKQLMAGRFDTARGIWSGINRGRADLALLSGHRIYGDEANYGRALELIEETERTNGWLIFFTHDVRPNPSPYGSRPEVFEGIVQAACASRCQILTVRDALAAAAPSKVAGRRSTT